MVNEKNIFNNFKKEFNESLNFIKESRKFIYVGLIIFIFSFFIGLFVPIPLEIQEKLMELIQEIIESTEGLNSLGLVSFIFFNNSLSSFNAIIFGVLFGIFPIMASFFNGYFIGFVSKLSIAEVGVSSLWKLLPHGIFELPAIFISFGLGIRVGFWLIWEPLKFYWEENKLVIPLFILFYLPTLIITLIYNNHFYKKMNSSWINFKNILMKSLKVFIFIIIPLLIIAAIVEGLLISFLG